MRPLADLSVLILAKNEESAISSCIRSVACLADDIVVLDSASEDETARISASMGARVVQFHWNGKYPKKKEWGLLNADLKTDWVLLLDADERVTPALAEEIAQTIQLGRVDALDIPLSYYWRGHELLHGQVVHKRSLLRRRNAQFPTVDDLAAPGITEVEGHYQPVVDGRIGTATARLVHDDPDPLSTWYERHNRYSDWEAHLRANPRARAAVAAHRSAQGRVLERLPFKPLVVFLYSYIVRQGWRDGRFGFEYAMSLAFYQFQISVKLRELADSKLQGRS